MSEEEELLSKISQVAGQINRRKNQNATNNSLHRPPSSHGFSIGHRDGRPNPPYRMQSHPYAKGFKTYQNRSLMLRNPEKKDLGHHEAQEQSDSPSADENVRQGIHGVTKRGGNTMKWISQEQSDAKAEGRKRYETQVHHQEKERVMHYARTSGPMSETRGISEDSLPSHVIMVNGISFRIHRGGSKLQRLSSKKSQGFELQTAYSKPPDNIAGAKETPKEASVNGVPFKRSKNGNLIRSMAVRKGASGLKEKTELCRKYTSTGSCPRGGTCSGIHDIHKVALCPSALRGSKCSAGDQCDLSHHPAPETSPTCTHFLRGRCTKEACPYSHACSDPAAPVCRNFAYLGYCEQGHKCGDRHMRECPDYTNDGRCRIRHCGLPHVDRASQMRKRQSGKAESDRMDVDEDLSSDDEIYDDIDSDDVDSDDFEEPEEIFGVETGELSKQEDFIGFD